MDTNTLLSVLLGDLVDKGLLNSDQASEAMDVYLSIATSKCEIDTGEAA